MSWIPLWHSGKPPTLKLLMICKWTSRCRFFNFRCERSSARSWVRMPGGGGRWGWRAKEVHLFTGCCLGSGQWDGSFGSIFDMLTFLVLDLPVREKICQLLN